MKRFICVFCVYFLFLGTWLLKPNLIFAASETILNFDSQIVAHSDGTFDVTETIEYDFGNNEKHGIFREIPTITKVGDLYRLIEINFTQVLRDGDIETYSVSKTSDKVSVKIGKADTLITGSHVYSIVYDVKNGVGSNYADHDEVFWNITGTEWEVPILLASATLRTDFGANNNNITCYTGVLNSKDKNCLLQESFPVVIRTSRILNANEGLTAVWGFPVGTFPKSILTSKKPASDIDIGISQATSSLAAALKSGVPLFGNFIIAPLILIWYLTRKRKKHFGEPVPNFDLPQSSSGTRLLPAEVGTIDSTKLEQDDVVATIFDLAIRKYIKIEEVTEKNKVLGIFDLSTDDYLIKKLKDYEDVTPFEKILLDRLFQDMEIVPIGSLKKDFYQTFNEMDKEIFGMLVAKLYYTKNPAVQKALLRIGAIIALATLNILLGGVLFYLSKKLNGRTALGDEVDFKIDGLKLFLKNMSRNYKWQAEKLYTVEQMIPYAIALGYIDKFMEQLKIIYPDYKPDWYSGNLAFFAVSSSLFSSMNSSFTMASPSSSGFGGGGFSGGGGGGGGGGSW